MHRTMQLLYKQTKIYAYAYATPTPISRYRQCGCMRCLWVDLRLDEQFVLSLLVNLLGRGLVLQV